MAIEEERFEAAFFVRPGEAAGMCQLQTDVQIIGSIKVLAMLADKKFTQMSEIGEGVFLHQQLIGIGSTVGADGDGLAAPNEFRSTRSETLPASSCQLGRPTVARAVPAFHRQNGEAIADRHTIHDAWPR